MSAEQVDDSDRAIGAECASPGCSGPMDEYEEPEEAENTSIDSSAIGRLLKESSEELHKAKFDIENLNETANHVNTYIKKIEKDLNKMRRDLLEYLIEPIEDEDRQELIGHVNELMGMLEMLAEQKGTMKLMLPQIQERIDVQRELEKREKKFLAKSEELKRLGALEKDLLLKSIDTKGSTLDEYLEKLCL